MFIHCVCVCVWVWVCVHFYWSNGVTYGSLILCKQSCYIVSSGRCPSVLPSAWPSYVAKSLALVITCNVNRIFVIPGMLLLLTSTILYHFLWSWPWLGVTGSAQSKTCWLHFRAHFSTEWDEMCGDEAIKGEHAEIFFQWFSLYLYSVYVCVCVWGGGGGGGEWFGGWGMSVQALVCVCVFCLFVCV